MIRVLLIEDSEEILETTTELLQIEGFEVITAHNGKEGLRKINNLLPDIIICDILIPQIDGYGVLKEVSKSWKTNIIPFIFLSAKVEKSDIKKGLDLGADDYVTKPFELEDLLKSIDGCLSRKKVLLEQYDNREELNNHIDKQRKIWAENISGNEPE